MKKRYMIAQDDDGHWYLFEADDKALFDDLMKCEWDEITASGEEWLEKRRIDGPHRLTFTDPVED